MAKGEPSVDILILGAGPAGCATALALLAGGVGRVWLADQPRQAPFAIGESAPPDVGRYLARLGVETDLCRLGHLAHYGNLSCWGADPPILDEFLSRGWDHGWHLDRSAFDLWLGTEATARGARLIHAAGLSNILPSANGWRVTLGGHGQIIARVVVDAAGRRAPLARRLGARRRRVDALVALAVRTQGKASEGLAGLTLVEAFPDGWWYAAPLPGGSAIVMLMTDRDIAAARGFRDPERFALAWRRTAELVRLVRPPCELSRVAVFPAFSGCISHAAGPGWIAVGDALLTLDPLASSGIGGALADALSAAPVMLAELGSEKAGDARRSYSRAADIAFKRYLVERRARYAAERRWPDSAFWARRTASLLVPANSRVRQ